MTAHNRIKELRNKKGLSQKEFARAFSDFIKNDENVKTVSYATISRWERGKNEPKLETWMKLAEFFDVPVPYLQGISENNASIHTTAHKSIGDIISIIYSLLIYMEKHPNMGKIPEKALNGITLSKRAYNALISASTYFGWQSENENYGYIEQISSNISKENYDVLNQTASEKDIDNICLAFRSKAIHSFNNAYISNESLINGAIEGVETALTVLNMRSFGEGDNLPSGVDANLYRKLVQLFKNTKKQIISLSKKYDK